MAKRTQRVKRQPQDEHDISTIWPERTETALIAIDPGERWTGVAFFGTNEDGEWYCQDAQEFSPAEFEDAFAELILRERQTPPPIVVYENWRLYADHAKEKTGSEMETSQHIGVIKYICRVHNEHVDRHEEAERLGKMMKCELQGGQCADPAMRPQRLTLVKQVADIKKPTRGILNKKKIKSVAAPIARELYGGRDHVKDAELHGWRHIIKDLGGSPAA